MFHTPNRLMLGAADLGHYELAQTLGLNAFWPLNDAAITTTPGNIDELIGGSDGTVDKGVNTASMDERQAILMRSSASDASLRNNWQSGGHTIAQLGDTVIPADGNCSFEFWTKWSVVGIPTYANTLFSIGGMDAWKRQFEVDDAIYFPSDGSAWDSGGASTGAVIDFTTEGHDITEPTHIILTQSKSGADYTLTFYINAVKARARTGIYKVAVPSATLETDLSTPRGGTDIDVYYQSAAFYTQTLSATDVSALYNAGKL